MSEFNSYLEMLSEQKQDFHVLLSRNSQIIRTPDNKKLVFADNKINPKIFYIVKELKKECEDFINSNNRFTTIEERAAIKYYNYSLNLPRNLNEFYFVDIKSAYITALYNNKILSKYIYDKINSLDKKDRLIVLGMLAYEPYLIEYINGERKYYWEETKEGRIKVYEPPIRQINKHASIFYYACNLIQELMEEIILEIKEKRKYFYRDSRGLNDNYLFYWVDGIFFQNKKDIEVITDILKSKGYNFTKGKCKDWYFEDKDSFMNISFLQEKEKTFELKIYNIPHYFQNYKDNKEFTDLVNTGNYSKLMEILAAKKYGEIK